MRRRKPDLVELDAVDLEAIIERTKTSALDTRDHEKLRATFETFLWMMVELEKTNTTLARLRKVLSINTKKTEKTSDVLKGRGDTEQDGEKSSEKPKAKKQRGHGRNGADAYEGAEKIGLSHSSLKSGDPCPKCEKGKVYVLRDPRKLVRVRGQAPLPATVYELESLRCHLCGEVFCAEAPEGIGEKKYDETSASMIGLLKYGSGLPFNRLERLEANFKIPLPASTQWGLVKDSSRNLTAPYEELIRQAAHGDIVYNDDTSMKILTLLKENQRIEETDSKERTGIFTSAIVATRGDHKIAIFLTGRQHAGENLEDVLQRRASELEAPIQMCDGSSRNEPKDSTTILANCMAHGRRKFVEVVGSFPQECRHVLESLRQVYQNDAKTRKKKMSPEQRLDFHQTHSTEIMEALERWMKQQLEQKKVEPNSSLGGAFSYMLKRWDKLTLFLRNPGAPLDNNICERALKKVILHRKNALFYKTENGARVGDIFMTLIYTAELSRINPFDYLTQLLKHADQVRNSPHEWMPWNYRTALAVAEPVTDRP